MLLEQRFALTAPVATVWSAFHDVNLLVECLPGASLNPAGAEDAEGIPLLFKVKLGPIAAGFAGRGQISFDEPAKSGSFSGAAVDAKTNSRVKGVARFVTAAADDDTGATQVTLTVDYSITGTLAQFSREGIVRALAEQLTRQFADNLQARLPQGEMAAPAPAAVAAQALAAEDAPKVATKPVVDAPVKPPPDTSTIDLWTLFKAWMRGLFASRP
jgi:carbon monoxide dehydrogenase subunit G